MAAGTAVSTRCNGNGCRGHFHSVKTAVAIDTRCRWHTSLVAGSAHCKIANVLVMQTRAAYPRQTNTYLPIFCCLRLERAMRQRLFLFQLQMRGLMLPVRCWKRSLQHKKCSGDANGSGLPTATKYLFADL